VSYENVARRYARAIFEIAKEAGSLASVGQEFTAFAGTYDGSDELRGVLSSPLVSDGARDGILKDLGERLKLSTLTLNTLRLLGQRRRFAALPDIARQLGRLIDEDASILRAEVTSAGALSEAYLKRLQGELEKATSRKVQIVHKQDPSLIAGVVTRIGDRVIDGSARARLSSFRESLLQS
jgi:F-type H+-transporting ATPase subunit delta